MPLKGGFEFDVAHRSVSEGSNGRLSALEGSAPHLELRTGLQSLQVKIADDLGLSE